MCLFLKSLSYAINGITLSLKQRNMRIHIMCAVIAILSGCIAHITLTEWCIILLCIGSVLALEVINTAIENLVDLVEPNHNPLAGKIKDLAAGAVLISSIISFIIGIILFWKYIF